MNELQIYMVTWIGEFEKWYALSDLTDYQTIWVIFYCTNDAFIHPTYVCEISCGTLNSP